tara:strand:- start:955 stop:3258 length:2304 start_codon:yes stop_codon:yes gene_type:complete
MAEKIKIAELSIDNKALIASMQEVKSTIQETTEAQKKMKGTTDENSEAFIKNEVKLKTLKQEYTAQQKVLQATTTSQEAHTKAINKEIKSIDEAAKNNKELKTVRNQLNASTEEGAKAIAEINKKLDQNTDFIKDNTSSLEKQKQNVGNYGSALDKARILTVAFGAALKAAGIGLIVAGVVKLTEALGRNQKVMDFVNVAANVFARVMNDIVTFLVDGIEPATKFMKAVFTDPQASIKKVGDLIKSNIIERFESALEVLGFLGSAAKKFFSGDFAGALADAKEAGSELVDVITGVDDSLNKVGEGIDSLVDGITKYGKEVLTTAQSQAELQKNSAVAIAQNRIILEQYDRQAEQLRQIRDDVSKTFEERIAANTKLGTVLSEQEALMIKNANLVVASAAAQNNLNNNTESYVALLDAQAEKAGILAQIEGLRSEQIVNRVGLIKEQSDATTVATDLEIAQAKDRDDKLRELRDKFLTEEQELAIIKLDRQAEAHILELETLGLREEEKAALQKAIIEDKEAAIAAVVLDYSKKSIAEDAKLQKAKLDNRKETLDGILALTNAETGIGQAALIAKQLIAVKEQAISLGLFTSKASLALSEATVDSSKGLVKSAAAAPFPANLPLIAGFAASIGGVIGAIKSATSKGKSSAKFADGGILSGASHANGGIKTPFGELEGEEIILTKGVTRNPFLRGLASKINQAGGGRKFASGGLLGDSVTNPNMEFIDYERLGATLAQANRSLPRPVVGVNEVVSVANRVEAIESAGNF